MAMNKSLAAIGLIVALSAPGAAVHSEKRRERVANDTRLMQQIRKELVTLPYYGVFDNLSFSVQGDTVTLYGQVLRPTTRDDAQRRVARLEAVSRVINQIEVLPLSPFDDSLRRSTYRAVFGTGSLSRYSLGANPSIHIIVRHGHVTLEGVVDNRMDRQLAYIAANGVPGAFSVTNHLRIGREM